MTTLRPGTAPDAKPERRRRPGRWIGPLRITPVVIVVALVMLGSSAYIGYVTLYVHDGQIPLLAGGFVALGAGWAAIAIGALLAMWRAASYARTGRATVLAVVGGLAGLAAIGCFSITALLTLVWRS